MDGEVPALHGRVRDHVERYPVAESARRAYRAADPFDRGGLCRMSGVRGKIGRRATAADRQTRTLGSDYSGEQGCTRLLGERVYRAWTVPARVQVVVALP